jgi:hypothetical protein
MAVVKLLRTRSQKSYHIYCTKHSPGVWKRTRTSSDYKSIHSLNWIETHFCGIRAEISRRIPEKLAIINQNLCNLRVQEESRDHTLHYLNLIDNSSLSPFVVRTAEEATDICSFSEVSAST